MIEAESQPGALSFRNFRFFMAMRLLSALAVRMQRVAVRLGNLRHLARPLSLGLVGFARFLPVFGFALVGCLVADPNACRRIPTTRATSSDWKILM
jgi:hypothetical protein